MIGQLLHKLMMILTQSITPLLQLSELLISNSSINSGMITLVSQSLSDISLAASSCSQLLTQFRNNSENNTSNLESINNIHRIATDVTNTIHQIVNQNDPMDPLVAGIDTNNEKKEDKK